MYLQEYQYKQQHRENYMCPTLTILKMSLNQFYVNYYKHILHVLNKNSKLTISSYVFRL